jgi:hypothetical protein
MVGLTKLLRKARDIINDEKSTEKAVSNAMHLVIDCYSFKRLLLQDKTYIGPGVRDFIEGQQLKVHLGTPRGIVSGRGDDSERVFGAEYIDATHNSKTELQIDRKYVCTLGMNCHQFLMTVVLFLWLLSVRS